MTVHKDTNIALKRIPGTGARPITYRPLHASATSVTNFYLAAFQNDGNLPETAGKLEHLLQLCAIRFHIYVLRLVPIGRPGLVCKRSASLAVNDDLVCHEITPSSCLRQNRKASFSDQYDLRVGETGSYYFCNGMHKF